MDTTTETSPSDLADDLDETAEAVTRTRSRRRYCYRGCGWNEWITDPWDHRRYCSSCLLPPQSRCFSASPVDGAELGDYGGDVRSSNTLFDLNQEPGAAWEADAYWGRTVTWLEWSRLELIAALHARPKRRGCPRKVDDAANWLGAQLARGPVPYPLILAARKATGISERTLDRAKAELGVTSARLPGSQTIWAWSLPPIG
jgi:hypothetical protein